MSEEREALTGWLENIMDGIISDMKGRRGLRQELDQIDQDTMCEMRSAWARIILENLPESE